MDLERQFVYKGHAVELRSERRPDAIGVKRSSVFIDGRKAFDVLAVGTLENQERAVKQLLDAVGYPVVALTSK